LGRAHHYKDFEVPEAGRVGRFREAVAIIRALWGQERVDFEGAFYHLDGVRMAPRRTDIPLWMGVGHPNAIRRTAELADGWMGSGGSSIAEFARSVPILKQALAERGRDPDVFPLSKRVFMAVDDNPETARRLLHRWFTEVYHNPNGAEASGLYGTREHVAARIEELIAMGANHLLLNPVADHAEQLEAVAEIVGLRLGGR
jgi:alkanesulfonate monooxygenase SsuD/methylene tetrahydromethanopterin reductase-like flavin-dependent oxidoreductase (luciferase family)